MQINSIESSKSRKVETIDVDADVIDLDTRSNNKNDVITLPSPENVKWVRKFESFSPPYSFAVDVDIMFS